MHNSWIFSGLIFILSVSMSSTIEASSLDSLELEYTKSFSKASKQAIRDDKFMFVFVYTSWSMPSQRMQETSMRDSSLISVLNDEYINVYINASRNKDFAEEYEIHVFPSFLVIDKWGNAIIRASGFKTPDQMIQILHKTRSKSKFLRQSIDSLMLNVTPDNINAMIDSVILYRDEYTAKNVAKRYLDKHRKDWGKEECTELLKDYFTLDKKYAKFVSKNHKVFFMKYDSIELKENIAFHVFINSLKKDVRGRLKFCPMPQKN